MSRILVDLLFYTGTKGGMESYVRQLYHEAGDRRLEFVGLASTELTRLGAPWFPGDLIPSGISGENRASWARGEVLSVSAAARRIRADLIHAPANIGPWSGATPVVLTVHDLLAFRHPQFVPGRYGPVLRTLVRRAAAHASRIITISEHSRADIEEVLHPGAAVDVIPLAGGIPAAPATPGHREPALLLALGNRLPHKNFERLVEALGEIPEAVRPRLVVAGGGVDDPLRPLVERLGLAPWVELTGWLADREIDALYARATAVVIPTLFEGFGLPVLEAMGRGCPVICSNLAVLRELAQNSAVYFDPLRTESLANTIVSALADPPLLAELARSGLLRSREFTWHTTAMATIDSFYRVLDADRSA